MKTKEQIKNGKELLPANKPGQFPLSSRKVNDLYLITTNQGNHYAETFDPSATSLICAAPDMFDALQGIVDAFGDQDSLLIEQCKAALSKAKGEL